MTTAPRSRAPDARDQARAALGHELAALFDQHASFVWRVLERLGVASSESEDALQEVFVIVAQRLPEYEERGGMRAWLFTIARQVASRARRSLVRRERRERMNFTMDVSVNGSLAGADPHAALERTEAARFVQSFLAELDERQSTVFYLAEVEGLTAPEIAACLDVGLNTVYGRLRLARERFERALRQKGSG